MDNVEVGGEKIGGDSKINLSINTIIKILGGISLIVNMIAGWAFYDLRTEFRENNGISAEEKRIFLKGVENEYDGKFDQMLREMLEMKGDIKVILDRENRLNPIQPSPGTPIEMVLPPL